MLSGLNKMFVKGKSGNPSGRPKVLKDVMELARTHAPLAIERLRFWAESDNAKASVAASVALLDRGYGKASQPLTGPGGEGPVAITVCWGEAPKIPQP